MSRTSGAILSQYRQYVNPAWAELVEAVGLPLDNLRGEGSWIVSGSGAAMLDMTAGFGAAILGHNPPALLDVLHRALKSGEPTMAPLGVVPEAGELAEKLVHLAGHGLTKVHFASSGAEAVDSALKFASARTGRRRFVSVRGAFHGLSIGATSLAGDESWRAPFPELWLPVELIECGDVTALEAELSDRSIAAVILEPVPASRASNGWSAGGLLRVAELCQHYGTVLVLDEVQTGLGRTGSWFAFHEAGPDFRPDVVIVSKALTAGIIPVAAVLMSDAIFNGAFAGAAHAKIQGSTLAGNRLAMTCGLAVLDAVESLGLVQRCAEAGERLKCGLADHLGRRESLPVVGHGLLLAFPCGDTPEEANARIVDLLRRGLLISPIPHSATFARLTPPLTISDDEIELFLAEMSLIL